MSFITYLAYKLQETMEYPNRNVLNKFLQTKTNQLFLKKKKKKTNQLISEINLMRWNCYTGKCLLLVHLFALNVISS